MKHITNKSLYLLLVCSGPFKWPFYYLEHFKNVVYNFWGFAVSVHRTFVWVLDDQKTNNNRKRKIPKSNKGYTNTDHFIRYTCPTAHHKYLISQLHERNSEFVDWGCRENKGQNLTDSCPFSFVRLTHNPLFILFLVLGYFSVFVFLLTDCTDVTMSSVCYFVFWLLWKLKTNKRKKWATEGWKNVWSDDFFCFDIWIVGSEFVINNRKTVIHPGIIMLLLVVQTLGSLLPAEHHLNATGSLNIVAEHVQHALYQKGLQGSFGMWWNRRCRS